MNEKFENTLFNLIIGRTDIDDPYYEIFLKSILDNMHYKFKSHLSIENLITVFKNLDYIDTNAFVSSFVNIDSLSNESEGVIKEIKHIKGIVNSFNMMDKSLIEEKDIFKVLDSFYIKYDTEEKSIYCDLDYNLYLLLQKHNFKVEKVYGRILIPSHSNEFNFESIKHANKILLNDLASFPNIESVEVLVSRRFDKEIELSFPKLKYISELKISNANFTKIYMPLIKSINDIVISNNHKLETINLENLKTITYNFRLSNLSKLKHLNVKNLVIKNNDIFESNITLKNSNEKRIKLSTSTISNFNNN